MPASVSVILPVYNGAALLDRAVRSVLVQTFSDWELIAVNDGSRDDSHDLLKAWAETDRRIRVIRLPENSGLSAAQTRPCGRPQGKWSRTSTTTTNTSPTFCSWSCGTRTRATCWFSATILSTTRQRERTRIGWKAGTRARRRRDLFVKNPVVPLGIAHRRKLVEKVGPFNEMLWREEDWDYWKRLTRAGAEFVFLPLKSGRYHVRAESLSRAPHLTARQRERAVANWEAGRPIFGDGISELREKAGGGQLEPQDKAAAYWGSFGSSSEVSASPHPNPLPEGEGNLRPHPNPLPAGEGTNRTHHAERDEYGRKVAFVSPYCILDWASPAASATRDGLRLLASQGFECQAFCGSWFNVPEELLVAEALAKLGLRHEVRKAKIGGREGRLLFLVNGGVGVTLFENASTRGWLSGEEAETFLAACEIFLRKNRPNVVWTYGNDPASAAVRVLAKRLDLPVLLAVHDSSYRETAPFRMVDYAVVPTEALRRHYWETLGLAALRLPYVVDPARVCAERQDGGAHRPREPAQQWRPDPLAPLYREFFGRLTHQPGPPLVPLPDRAVGVGVSIISNFPATL